MKPLRLTQAGLLTLWLLGACVSVLPEPETPDALYRIEASTNGPTLSENLLIREPEASRIFAGSALVSEDSQGAVRLVRGAEWADPATRMLQLALADSFTHSPTGAAVLPETGVRARYALSSRLTMLGFVRGEAVCRVSVSLIETRSRALITQTRIVTSQNPSSVETGDRAVALKGAAQDCVAEMAKFAADQLTDIAAQ